MTGGAPSPGGPYLGMSVARLELAARLQRFIEAECADLECRHGRLSSEGCPAGCWGGEVRQLPKRQRAQRKKAAERKRAA